MKKKPITLNGSELNIPLQGNLDTAASTLLIEEINRFEEEEVTHILFDATKLEYIASTGIRAVLFAAQMFNNEPAIDIVGAKPEVRKVFDLTGISSFVNFI